MKLGIVGYGSYIPCYRITAQEIARENNHDWKKITASLGVTEKSVPASTASLKKFFRKLLA